MLIRVQEADFDMGQVIAQMRGGDAGVGAVVSFLGTVREMSGRQSVEAMELEHYPGMTEKVLQELAQQAMDRWPLRDVAVIHRVGKLKPCDQIVLVVAASAHRGDAFQACEFIIDFLKTRAPFWKKEYRNGGAQWVDARSSDDEALRKWE